jgi:hypothetical protein
MLPSVSKSERAKHSTTYQIRATLHRARGSASSKGNPLLMMMVMMMGLMLASLVVLTMVDGIVYNSHPPSKTPQYL